MKALWWGRNFDDTYSRFCLIFKCVVLLSFALRIMTLITHSFEAAFGSPHGEYFILMLIITLFLEKLKSASPILQKIIMYLLIETLNISLKISSIYHIKNEAILFCIESTLLTLLFQTNIFANLYISFSIALKHLVIWYIIDAENIIESKNITAIGVNFVILSAWTIFEKSKRDSLMKMHLAIESSQKAHNQVSELLRLFPDGLVIIDKQFEIKYINESILKILKCEPENLTKVLSEIHFKGKPQTLKEILLEDGTSKFIEGLSLGINDLGSAQYEWMVKTILWDQEEGYMVTVKDVSKLLSFERITGENNAKSSLIRSISHELRTPVNGISLILEDLQDEIPKKFKNKLQHISLCTRLLNFQINDILDYSELFSKNFSLNNAFCNLKSDLNKCANFIKVRTDYKGLIVLTQIDDKIPDTYFTDSFRVQKIVMNLLNNAVKFTSKGTIELKAILISKGVEIQVKDTGIGIPKERLGQIFEMFTNDSPSGLSGLGLHISSRILKLLGSHFVVESELGQGASFKFVLPLNIENSYTIGSIVDNDIPCEEISSLSLKMHFYNIKSIESAKIMIVDDNDLTRKFFVRILKNLRINCVEAVNGLEAVEIVVRCDKMRNPMKCVIMDCEMPVMDGWEASRIIRNKHSQGIIREFPAIIAYTAYSSKEDIARCFDCGMVSYLIKPTPKEQILNIISKYLRLG